MGLCSSEPVKEKTQNPDQGHRKPRLNSPSESSTPQPTTNSSLGGMNMSLPPAAAGDRPNDAELNSMFEQFMVGERVRSYFPDPVAGREINETRCQSQNAFDASRPEVDSRETIKGAGFLLNFKSRCNFAPVGGLSRRERPSRLEQTAGGEGPADRQEFAKPSCRTLRAGNLSSSHFPLILNACSTSGQDLAVAICR